MKDERENAMEKLLCCDLYVIFFFEALQIMPLFISVKDDIFYPCAIFTYFISTKYLGISLLVSSSGCNRVIWLQT